MNFRPTVLFLACLLALTPSLPAAEFQLLVFPKENEPKQMELESLPASELASYLAALQPAIEARRIPVSGDESETRLRWQVNHVDHALTVRTKLDRNLQFGIALRTTAEAGLFGASSLSGSRSAAGDVAFPHDRGYLLDAGNVLIVFAPVGVIPATTEASQLTLNP